MVTSFLTSNLWVSEENDILVCSVIHKIKVGLYFKVVFRIFVADLC